MKACKNCEGKGQYMKTSSVDKMFSELTYCRECKGTGKIEGVTK